MFPTVPPALLRCLNWAAASLSFGYRIMAVRKNYESIRFADRMHDLEKIRAGHEPLKPMGTKSSHDPAKATQAAPARAALKPIPAATTSR